MADIVLIFRGQEHILPEGRAFEAGEAVEEIATLPEVLGWAKRPQFHKMSRCFAAMLAVAGCRAAARDVHAEMMAGFRSGNPGAHFAALNALVAVLMDGAPAGDGGADDAGKQEAAS